MENIQPKTQLEQDLLVRIAYLRLELEKVQKSRDDLERSARNTASNFNDIISDMEHPNCFGWWTLIPLFVLLSVSVAIGLFAVPLGRYSVSLIVFCGAIGWFNFGRAGVKIARLQSAKGAGAKNGTNT